jgi:hypothetical protein
MAGTGDSRPSPSPAMRRPQSITSQPRTSDPPLPSAEGEDRLPFFGSWTAIHLAVIVCAVAVMALVALFSRWPF